MSLGGHVTCSPLALRRNNTKDYAPAKLIWTPTRGISLSGKILLNFSSQYSS